MAQTDCYECKQPLSRAAQGESIIVRLDHADHTNRRAHALCAQLRAHLVRHYKGADIERMPAVQAYEQRVPLLQLGKPCHHFLSAKWLYERIMARPK